MIPAFNGAVGLLGDLWNWELFGGVTEDEAATLGFDIYCSMLDCELDKRMIGSIQFYAGTLPAGVLLCDGASYAEVDYPELYASLSGVGGVFDVPDLRGKFLIGADVSYPVGSVGGDASHVLTVAEMPAHEHSTHSHDANVDVEAIGAPDLSAGIGLPDITGQAGGGIAHNNMPPFHALDVGIVALPVVVAGVGGGVEIAVVVDEQPEGTNGGDFFNNTWVKRELNTIRVGQSWVSLVGNEVQLTDGEYLIIARMPSRDVEASRGRMVRVSDSTEFLGQNAYSPATAVVVSVVSVLGTETFSFEHRGKETRLSSGLGLRLTNGVETYSQVTVVKYG